jgi:hypothetical protein
MPTNSLDYKFTATKTKRYKKKVEISTAFYQLSAVFRLKKGTLYCDHIKTFVSTTTILTPYNS